MKKRESSDLLIRPAQPEDYAGIREFLLESSSLYPGIEFWWDSRVRPTIDQGRRIVLVVDAGSSLEGLFIGKPVGIFVACWPHFRILLPDMEWPQWGLLT